MTHAQLEKLIRTQCECTNRLLSALSCLARQNYVNNSTEGVDRSSNILAEQFDESYIKEALIG